MSLTALADSLGLAKSTVHGLCGTLVESGLVTRFEDGTYHLGIRIMDLAHAYLSRTDLTSEFVKVLDSETLLPEESIVMSVLDEADIVYVAARNGGRPFGFNFRIGMRLPAHCTASGKVHLSALPPGHIESMAEQDAFRALTPRTITDAGSLLEQLTEVREQGYAIDDEETRLGMVCIGAPVFASGQVEPIAAVAVSLPKEGLEQSVKADAIETVVGLGRTLSQRLGGVPRSH